MQCGKNDVQMASSDIFRIRFFLRAASVGDINKDSQNFEKNLHISSN